MRKYCEWRWMVDEMMLIMGGVTSVDFPRDFFPFYEWWATGCCPKWVARQCLGMDNG